MKGMYLAAAAVAIVVAPAAGAQTVNDTSLQNINGTFGTSSATTATTTTGTRTTVTGPGPNAGGNRATGAVALGSWYQNSVGAGSTVGITTDYARSGNGSAYFDSTAGDTGKADLVYNFSAPVALSSLSSFSFDFYRDGASTTNAIFSPVLRLGILKDGNFAGTLVYENYYTTNAASPTDSWTTLSGTLNSGNWWATNAALGPTFAAADGGTKSLADWLTGNTGSALSVYGLEVGIGSGWSGTFYGAVDNVNVNFTGGPSVAANFEVAIGAVPEPGTWAMMIFGFGVAGAAVRRRRGVSGKTAHA